MKNYGSGSTRSSTLPPASELCARDKPFDEVTFVEEANYTELQQNLQGMEPYPLDSILHVQNEFKQQTDEVLAAVGIANLFHDEAIKYKYPDKGADKGKKLVGVVCPSHSIMVVPNHKMFAATLLQPWLCSTTIKPDIAVYPNGEDVSEVEKTNIPYFLAEYYSVDMVATARQCAIKLILLLQLNRLHGCTENKVIGIALPQMHVAQMHETSSELKPITEDNLTSQVTSSLHSAAPSNKKKMVTQKNLNAVVQVTVEWNFKALRFVVTYTVLEKENAVSAIEKVLKSQIKQMTIQHCSSIFIELTDEELFQFKCNIVQLLAELWENEKAKYSDYGVPETAVDSILQSNSYVNWKKDDTQIEQYDSNISLLFKLINTKDGTSLFLKSFSRPSVPSHLAIIERHLTGRKVQRSLCSSYIMNVHVSTAFHVFRGLHAIDRGTAKDCLIDFLRSVKEAVDELTDMMWLIWIFV